MEYDCNKFIYIMIERKIVTKLNIIIIESKTITNLYLMISVTCNKFVYNYSVIETNANIMIKSMKVTNLYIQFNFSSIYSSHKREWMGWYMQEMKIECPP